MWSAACSEEGRGDKLADRGTINTLQPTQSGARSTLHLIEAFTETANGEPRS